MRDELPLISPAATKASSDGNRRPAGSPITRDGERVDRRAGAMRDVERRDGEEELVGVVSGAAGGQILE
jgi:hypothetical protein